MKWKREPALPEDKRPSRRVFVTGKLLRNGIREAWFQIPAPKIGRPIIASGTTKINDKKWKFHAQF